tara:strand:+ start:920 stop:2047 length:1128 start_codon:yes stop_codon:yes gene_type:complete
MANKVLFNDLGKQWEVIKDDALPRIDNLFSTSAFINGPDVNTFEENFAKYIGTDYAVGVSNGTDALKLCVEALELKGKVGIIIPANTFIATLLGAEMALPNAEFVLVDCDEYYQMDTDILKDTLIKKRKNWDHCIIIPVHLYGCASDIENIMHIAEENDCWVIEDCSQAHGTTTINGRPVGTFGHMAAFSMYPGKNLGAAGDAGVITTNNEKFYDTLKLLQNWGAVKKYYYEIKGYNNRLDTIQAIIVDEKLKHLNGWNDKRRQIASWYDELIQNENIIKPKKAPHCGKHTYHIYCVRLHGVDRDEIMTQLNDNGIQSGIHYPIPIEKTKIYEEKEWYNPITRLYAEQTMSLPMHPFMSRDDVERVAEILNGVLV